MYCDWASSDPLLQKYHDEEWGFLVEDDIKQFEYLSLEVFQCGLSWTTIFKKRQIFIDVFDGFDFRKIASFSDERIQAIIKTPGMIASLEKAMAIRNNAIHFQEIITEFGSFLKYLQSFCGPHVIVYKNHPEGFVPSSNGLSTLISKDLKKRGLKYVGPTVIYSHLQACGIVNDHDRNCPCFSKIASSCTCVEKEPVDEVGIVFYGDKRSL